MQTIHIRVLRHSAFYSPLLLTIASGHLHDEGLEPVYDIQDGQNTVVGGLQSGEIDVAQSAVAASFAGLQQNKPDGLVHFAQINQRDGFYLTRRGGDGPVDWQALIGQSILVDHFFQPFAMFRYALHLLQINEHKIDIIDAGDVAQIDRAFRQGQGAFVHQQGPAAQQLVHDGVADAYTSVGQIIGPVAFSSLCCHPDWLATQKASAFVRAYRKGQQDAIKLSAGDISERIGRFFPEIGPKVLEQTVADYQQLGCWSSQTEIDEHSYARALDVFEYSGLISRRFDFAELIRQPPV